MNRNPVVRRRLPLVPVASLLALTAVPAAHAQSRDESAGPTTHATAVPLFEHSSFVAGPAPLGSVSFTPGARITPQPAAARAHEAVATPREPDPEPVVRPTLPREPAPASRPVAWHPSATSEAYGCRIDDRGIEHVELALGAESRAVQVALATRNGDAVALVTVGRSDPRQPREGLVFPEARIVTLPREGSPHVAHTIGFEPDASVAMAPDGQLFVASYTRLDVHAAADAAAPSVRVAVLDPRTGSTRSGPRVIEGTAGQHIDSPLVPWRGGFAMMLGQQDDAVRVLDVAGAHAEHGGLVSRPVRERLSWLGEDGFSRHAAWSVTDVQGDDAIGRYRVGLGTVGDELAMSWTEASTDRTGVWSRRLVGDALTPATRLVARSAWGSEIARDGSGVLFRSGGETSAPVRLFYAPWQGREPFSLGAGWDPATALVHGRVLVAGVTLAGNDGAPLEALVAASQPGSPPRAIDAPRDAVEGLTRATDFDLAATDDGVVVAWIESTARDDDDAPRRMAVARVACR